MSFETKSLNYGKNINPELIRSFNEDNFLVVELLVDVDGGSRVTRKFSMPIRAKNGIQVALIKDYEDGSYLQYEDMLEIKACLKEIVKRSEVLNLC